MAELQAASNDFSMLLGGITFPLTKTGGIFAFTPFGKAMAARQRMAELILKKAQNCRSGQTESGMSVENNTS